MNERLIILQGGWIEQLKTLPDASVQCCVTSPPYWGLRDYSRCGCVSRSKEPSSTICGSQGGFDPNHGAKADANCPRCGGTGRDETIAASQLGLEPTPEEYVAKVVEGFREVRRVLREDGTLWLNLGDSYCGGGNYRGVNEETLSEKQASNRGANGQLAIGRNTAPPALRVEGLKPKDLVGIPWMIAFALRADGWYLRSDIIWHKPNPMPESVTDRPTKAHEYIFLLTKNGRYFYDAEAVKEQSIDPESINGRNPRKHRSDLDRLHSGDESFRYRTGFLSEMDGKVYPTRNKRSVWTVPSQPYPESHFATFPEALIKPCILAGTSARGCCPKCGAPWERVVEKEQVSGGTEERKANGHPSRYGDTQSGAGRTEDGTWSMPHFETRSKTTGWQPTCGHSGETTTPCTVLDPFGGSGTTGQVALELGRRAILVELNPQYIKLIRERTNVTPGLPL